MGPLVLPGAFIFIIGLWIAIRVVWVTLELDLKNVQIEWVNVIFYLVLSGWFMFIGYALAAWVNPASVTGL